MPTFDFQCKICQKTEEARIPFGVQSIVIECPGVKGRLCKARKIVSAPMVIVKSEDRACT